METSLLSPPGWSVVNEWATKTMRTHRDVGRPGTQCGCAFSSGGTQTEGAHSFCLSANKSTQILSTHYITFKLRLEEGTKADSCWTNLFIHSSQPGIFGGIECQMWTQLLLRQ